jgi:twitching motility protein PilT
MAEIILGVGQDKSVREIVTLAEEELRKVEGLPREVKARSESIQLLAARPDFEGPFLSFSFQAQTSDSVKKIFRDAVDAHGSLCTLSEEGGCEVLVCAANGEADLEALNAVADEVSHAIGLPEVWRLSGAKHRVDHVSTELLFKAMVQYKASDIHLCAGEQPVFRVDNHTKSSEILGRLSAVQILSVIQEITSDAEWKEFGERKQVSFNYHQLGLGYARVSAFMKAGAPHCTFRFLPEKIPSFEDLHIPRDTMVELASLHHGLILVTGMTGSGKSTTVAALVDWINSNRPFHILTIENPVEYVHHNKKAIMSQRSTGTDVENFDDAVTGALRHDPDVIMIGEMRDPDTIRSAINAAATGHLVISTLHANTASEVVNRVISFFDPVERDLVKLQLRDCMKCVICQRLVPKLGGGRVPALEFMFNDIKAINDGVADGNTDGIRIGMQQTVSHSFIFEEYLCQLYRDKIISLEDARSYTTEVSILDQMIMGTYSVPRLDAIKQGGH